MMTKTRLSDCDVQLGDVVLVSGTSRFARLIRWFTRGWQEEPTRWTHAAIVTSDGPAPAAVVAEAWALSRLIPLAHYEYERVQIWRDTTLRQEDKDEIWAWLTLHLSRPYGVLYILMAALDGLLAKALRQRDLYCFRRLAPIEKSMVCSTLVSGAYAAVGRTFGVTPNQATPDDISDYLERHTTWHPIPSGRKWWLVCEWEQGSAGTVER
jgi:hypothetical protein